MITENKKEYFKNYRLKNRDKLNAYQRQKYYERKNKIKEKNEDIKKDIEKLKEKFRLLFSSPSLFSLSPVNISFFRCLI